VLEKLTYAKDDLLTTTALGTALSTLNLTLFQDRPVIRKALPKIILVFTDGGLVDEREYSVKYVSPALREMKQPFIIITIGIGVHEQTIRSELSEISGNKTSLILDDKVF
jgi:hypothetical protein